MRWRTSGVVLAALVALVTTAAPAQAETIREMQWYLGAVKATAAHSVTRGDNVVVAVIDSGVDAGHPDLAGAVLAGVSFSGAQSQAGRTDPQGHGTKMAGIIAARGGGANNALGIAPRAKILPIAVPQTGLSVLAEPIRWAADHGAQVINLSVGARASGGVPPATAQAVAYAQSKNIVVVTAAGNSAEDGVDGNALARLPGVVSVSGTNRAGTFWNGSSQGGFVAISAPAENIVNVGARNIHSTGYSGGGATSESTAIVSGVAALIRHKFPQLDAANVVNRLIRSATDKGAPNRDPLYGFGVVDAQSAVTANIPPVTANPLGEAPAGQTQEASPGRAGSTEGPAATEPSGGVSLARLGILLGVVLLGVVLLMVLIWALTRRRGPPPGPPTYSGYPPGPPYGQPPQYGQPSQYGPQYGQPPPQPGPPQYGQPPQYGPPPPQYPPSR